MNCTESFSDGTNALLAATFDGLDVGVVIYDANEQLVLCNQEFRRQLAPIADILTPGTPWRTVIQTCIDKKLAVGVSDMDGDLNAQCDALRKVTERQTSQRELSGRYYDMAYTPMANGGFFITRVDITDRVIAENRMKERDELIRLVVEACPATILMNRADTGEILFISPQAIALYGEQTSSRDYYVSLDDRTRFVRAVRHHGEVQDYRLKLKNAQGEPFPAAVSARLIQWGGQDVIVSHSRDLTDELALQDQLTRQREQVFQSEKMSALGGLLAGVSHELNNPLSVVVGHALMLSDETEDPDVLRKITKIQNAAERCSKIVRTFLTMAREDPVRPGPVDIPSLLETARQVAHYGDAGRTLTVELTFDDNLPQIKADENQLTQVIVNLIINAEHAIAESGVGDYIRLSARYDRADDQVRLGVRDNGPGIPDDVRARIFEPFFTTKGIGEGSGMGLAVCHRIIAAHKGSLSVSQTEEAGTCFTITLPVGNLDQTEQQTVTPVMDKKEAMRVLVIDDEADVADLNVEVLQRGGIDADAVHHAENAGDMLRRRHYDVVLSDLNMRGLDGRGVFEMIAREFPDLINRTGFVTGDTMGRASQAFLRESGRPYIEKPVSPKELRAFVMQLSMEGPSE